MRREKELYYHSGRKECDFVLREGLRISEAIQVSLDLDSPETNKREIEGAVEAMAVYKLDRGLILTFEEEDVLSISGKKLWYNQSGNGFSIEKSIHFFLKHFK